MTPLLQRITRELTLPQKDRTFVDGCGLLSQLDDVHSFEVSSVYELACELAVPMIENALDTRRFNLMEAQSFLPAPKTWIERIDGEGNREGFLLIRDEGSPYARVMTAATSGAGIFGSLADVGGLMLDPPSPDVTDKLWMTIFPTSKSDELGHPIASEAHTFILYALLAMINTPRVLGRKQHMPHRGLERRLTRHLGVGAFPLHAWTELVLSVSPTGTHDDQEHQAHLTGQKCLHFCRSHLRIRCGRLEVVRAHWRGDAALGIKRTRYKVTA